MKKTQILVVDDEYDIAEILKLELTDHNPSYEITLAHDGAEAIKRVLELKPDLIIMDVMMPKMTGYEVLKALRTVGEKYQDIPVIAISAKESMESHMLEWATTEFISKPFDMSNLLARADTLIRNRRKEQGKRILPKATRKKDPTQKRAMILAVEDFVLQKLTTLLERNSYEVSKALDHDDALETAAEEQPNLILVQYWHSAELYKADDVIAELFDHGLIKPEETFIFGANNLAPVAQGTFPAAHVIGYEGVDFLLRRIADDLKLAA
jgi:DNA-binding response OmpR family regulator